MANSPNPDRDTEYMMKNWGTNRLITDYGDIKMEKNSQKMLREIVEDDMTPKKRNKGKETELFERFDDSGEVFERGDQSKPLFGWINKLEI